MRTELEAGVERVCIFLFSGTGMTRYIAGKMTAEFEEHQVSVNIFPIENVRIEDISFQDYNEIYYF